MRIKLQSTTSLSQIQSITAAFLSCEDCEITHIATDSREVERGDLFIALRGENFDGADYAEDVLKKGGYVLSERKELSTLTVSSAIDSFLKIAVAEKKKLKNLKYTVAVTGSVGKTTTKNLIKLLLEEKFKVHATEENQNNVLGLAYTLLKAPLETEILVCELGMNHRGEISQLSQCINPDIAVITNIGSAHIGNLGSRKMIATAKLEICDGISRGITIVPYEEDLLFDAKGRFTISLTNCGADALLSPISETDTGSRFKFTAKGLPSFECQIRPTGRHILSSLSFAIAVASLLNVDKNSILRALEKFTSDSLRQKFIRIGKFNIYDDTYSSSPEAVIAILDMLSLYKDTPKSALLGDMLELGAKTEQMHRKIGEEAYNHGIVKLYAFGVYAPFIAEGAVDAGMPRKSVFVNTDPLSPSITAEQIAKSYEGELLLIKASHSLHAERIYDFLKVQNQERSKNDAG